MTEAARARSIAAVEVVALHGRAWRGSSRIVAGVLLLVPFVIAAVAPGLISPYDPAASSGPALLPPGLSHPFGTDDLGRDLLARIAAGARTSLSIGAVVTAVAIAFGVLIGVAAGYLGGLVDLALTRLTEMVMILPRFLVALLVGTIYGPSIVNIAVVLALMSWTGLARIVRAETMAQRAREHVIAARALGAGPVHIMRRHILPSALVPARAVAAPIATAAILAEAGLGFLGIADPILVSWGTLIRDGQSFFAQGWWLSVFPGLAVVLTCLGAALLMEQPAR